MRWIWIQKSKERWGDVSQQRKLFDEAAIKLGVTRPEDWYKITSRELNKGTQVSSILVNHYSTSLATGAVFRLVRLLRRQGMVFPEK
jgi:hypothetical protein